MPVQFVPFTTLDPTGEHGGGLLRAEGVIHAFGGMRSLQKPSADGSQAGNVVGSIYFHHSQETTLNYIGDSATELHGTLTDIYVFTPGSPGTYADVSRAAAYTLNGSNWHFASFGNDIWAANFLDVPQRRTNNAGNFADGVTSTFVPRPRFLAVVRDFMIAASLTNVGRFGDEFAWSDISDATWYDPANATRPASLAGAKRILSRPGQIMGVVGGEYGVIWKRNSMHALQFTGGEDIWRLDEISGSIGTPFPHSIVECRDGYRRFWGGDAFYEQAGLGEPTPIGGAGGEGISALVLDGAAYLTNQSLTQTLDYSAAWIEEVTFFGGQDPELPCVFWFYRDREILDTYGCNRYVCYDYKAGVWTSGIVGVDVTAIGASRVFRSLSKDPPRYLVGSHFTTGPSTMNRFQFQSTTYHAVTLATQRFFVGQEGADGQPQHVQIEAVLPVVTPRQDTFGSDYRLEALPSTLAVRVIASNEPHFQQQLGGDGVQVSPRSDSLTVADANEYGWLATNVAGRSFLLELSVPESAIPLRGFAGCWISYKVLA